MVVDSILLLGASAVSCIDRRMDLVDRACQPHRHEAVILELLLRRTSLDEGMSGFEVSLEAIRCHSISTCLRLCEVLDHSDHGQTVVDRPCRTNADSMLELVCKCFTAVDELVVCLVEANDQAGRLRKLAKR